MGMDYDVVGTLQIDTSDFETKLKQARGTLDTFKKDFKSLNNLQSLDSLDMMSMSLKSIDKNVAKIVQSLKNLKLPVDEAKESVAGIGKEIDNAAKKTKKLVESFSKLGDMGKWFPTQMFSQSTNRWVHDQLSTTKNFFKGFTQGFQKVKEEEKEAVLFMNELHEKFNQLNISSRDFLATEAFRQANIEAEKLEAHTKELIAANERLSNTYREISKYSYAPLGNQAGVGFAGSSSYQRAVKGAEQYVRSLKEIEQYAAGATRSNYKLEQSLTAMGGKASEAQSKISTLGGVLRTLRTTLSMIGGMFVWEFAFNIMDATKATISAKSEMESYYKTLNMGASEINQFNAMLDQTISKYQKMNKFQLGETITALGVEFGMNTQEMNQIAKVAPMLVNEYLRAGRTTEEAILAIKDISQGEFLRLSRETGVGKKEIMEAGWSGDNKDIISLYQALEKIGKDRHWDVFASKANSLNDVLLITQNRMTEFATMLSDWVTPIIVGAFNGLGDAFEGARQWMEGLGTFDKSIVTFAGSLVMLGGSVGILQSKVIPALTNLGQTFLANSFGVDKEILKLEGLSTALAHSSMLRRAESIATKEGSQILHNRVMALMAEEEANKLGLTTTQLKTSYTQLLSNAEKAEMTTMEARKSVQEAMLLAEQEGIELETAHQLVMERNAMANRNVASAILIHKLGLDALVTSDGALVLEENGLAAALLVKMGVMEADAAATATAEAITATFVATIGVLAAALVALGIVLVPIIMDFIDLSESFGKVNDVLTNGADKIDELKKKQDGYQKTIDELSSKTNLTTEETEKLDEARTGLAATTDALKAAEEEYSYALQVQTTYTNYVTRVEAARYRNLKQLNKEMNEQNGTTGKQYIDNTYGMSRAAKESYKYLQQLTYVENHRKENSRKLKKYQEDYNATLNDYEDALEELANPETQGFDRLGAEWDKAWAGLRIQWIEFWQDPWKSVVTDSVKWDEWNKFTDSFNKSLTDMGKAWDDFWKPVTDFFNNFSIDSSWNPFEGLFDGLNLDGMKKFDLSSLMDWTADGVAQLCDGLWGAIDSYLSNHVPMYGWLKNLLPNDGAEQQGQQAGGSVVKGVKTGIAPVDNVVNWGLGGINGIINRFGSQWGTSAASSGGKIKSGVKTGSNGTGRAVQPNLSAVTTVMNSIMPQWGSTANKGGTNIKNNITKGSKGTAKPVKSEISDITSSLSSASGSWWNAAYSSAKSIIDAIKAGLNRQSPGDAAKMVRQEMIDANRFIMQSQKQMYDASIGVGKSVVAGLKNSPVTGGQLQKSIVNRNIRNTTNHNNKNTNLNVNVDLSNARIYGIDDLDNHIKRSAEETFYELNSPDGALGY